jgi:hypothetical protein
MYKHGASPRCGSGYGEFDVLIGGTLYRKGDIYTAVAFRLAAVAVVELVAVVSWG